MEIRRATVDDIDVLCGLRLAFFEALRPVSEETRDQLRPSMRHWFEKHLPEDGFIAMLCCEGGEPVASAFLEVQARIPHDKNPTGLCGHVTNVYTHPDYRGRGVATALMRALLDAGRQRGVHLFDLIAAPAGQPIYEKLGFRVVEEENPQMRLAD